MNQSLERGRLSSKTIPGNQGLFYWPEIQRKLKGICRLHDPTTYSFLLSTNRIGSQCSLCRTARSGAALAGSVLVAWRSELGLSLQFWKRC